MPYTVTKLITNAYYTSGIVGRGFQTVSGSQLNDGLDLLNEILTFKYVDSGFIPYYRAYDFNAVQGQEKYFVPNLIEVETLTFFINTVRYQMGSAGRVTYFGSSRADSVESLPFTWHVENELGGASIYLYFKPNVAYPMQLWGKFGLAEATLNEDLLLTYDMFYVTYLKYALASLLCVNFNYSVPPGLSQELEKVELHILNTASPMDLRMQKMSTLTEGGAINYGIVNLSGGFTSP